MIYSNDKKTICVCMKKILILNIHMYIMDYDKGKTVVIRRRKTRGSLNEDSQLPENEEFGTGFFI